MLMSFPKFSKFYFISITKAFINITRKETESKS